MEQISKLFTVLNDPMPQEGFIIWILCPISISFNLPGLKSEIQFYFYGIFVIEIVPSKLAINKLLFITLLWLAKELCPVKFKNILFYISINCTLSSCKHKIIIWLNVDILRIPIYVDIWWRHFIFNLLKTKK